MNYTIVSIILAYFGILLLVSIGAAKKISSNDDFLIAGRRLGPFLLAGALAATEIGGGSSLGVVEKAYGNWGFGAIWYVVTVGIAFAVLAFVTPKFRQTMVKTIPEYFKKKYGAAPGIVTALFMMLFPMIGFTAAQFIVSGVLISVITGFSYKISVMIIASVVTSYAVLGGLWSVTLIDFIQIFIIVIGMLLSLPLAIHQAGGWQHIVSTIEPAKLAFTTNIGWKTIASLIVMYIASFGVGQEVLQKFYAAKNAKTAQKASLLAAAIFTLYAFIPATLGIIAYSMVKSGMLDKSIIILNGAKYAFPVLAMHILPAFFVGILFAGLVGATISCSNSDILGGASIFANDVYKIYLHKKATNKQVLTATRIAIVVLGILSMLIAQMNTQGIIAVLMFSFSLRASGFFFPYLLGHYWRKASWAGAIASIISGVTTVFLVQYHFISTLFGMEPIVPGLLISLLVFIFFTNLFPAHKHKETKFEFPSSNS